MRNVFPKKGEQTLCYCCHKSEQLNSTAWCIGGGCWAGRQHASVKKALAPNFYSFTMSWVSLQKPVIFRGFPFGYVELKKRDMFIAPLLLSGVNDVKSLFFSVIKKLIRHPARPNTFHPLRGGIFVPQALDAWQSQKDWRVDRQTSPNCIKSYNVTLVSFST